MGRPSLIRGMSGRGRHLNQVADPGPDGGGDARRTSVAKVTAGCQIRVPAARGLR